jgi:hypothetical protein
VYNGRVKRVTLGCTVALLALAASGCGTASPEASAAKNRIERAFVLFLQENHPGFSGPSRCPSKREVHPEYRTPCLAEIHKGKKYVEVWASPTFGPTVEFHHVSTNSWTRRWSKYAPSQGVSPGLISVNASDIYDWRWLLLGVDFDCRQKHKTACTAGALDGPWNGYPLFFAFRCNVEGSLITCRNKLGDAIRWRPDPGQTT